MNDYMGIAHVIANAKPGSVESEQAQKAFRSLNPFQQMSCRIEIDAIRRAKRGEQEAEVLP